MFNGFKGTSPYNYLLWIDLNFPFSYVRKYILTGFTLLIP